MPVAAPAPAPNWRTVVQGLDDARAAAFAHGDAGQLAAIYAPGSPALVRDLAALRALQASRSRAPRLRFEVLEARVIFERGDRVELEVVDRLGPYEVRDARGRMREARKGRGVQRWELTLLRDGSEWRVLEVARATSDQAATMSRAAASRSGRAKE